MVTKFSTGIDLDNILDKFDGQGHRSKVKVSRSLKVIPMMSARVQNIGLWSDVIILCDVMPSQTAGCGRCSNT